MVGIVGVVMMILVVMMMIIVGIIPIVQFWPVYIQTPYHKTFVTLPCHIDQGWLMVRPMVDSPSSVDKHQQIPLIDLLRYQD